MILDLMETMDTIQASTEPEEGNNTEEKTEPTTSADWPPSPTPCDDDGFDENTKEW
ncbi:MAG: hypothetical protein OXH65_05200 [Paracoccaceae bacterium]|nr:hypothetical protein [Paracoccaceae bacterium]MDE2674488.1 hypothetical protein [Paracoccaceae bacterium]